MCLGGHRLQRGFTLLELMVVLVIIGIILSFATLSIHTSDPAAEEAARLVALVDLAGEESVLTVKELGIVFNRSAYHFVRYDNGSWYPLEDDAQFRERVMPEGITFKVSFDGVAPELRQNDDDDRAERPQVVFLSSGERTPAEVDIRMNQSLAYRIELPEFGKPIIKAGESAYE